MKVLILITKSSWGGAQRYVYDLATNLPKDSFDVEVIAGGNGILVEKLKEAGVKASGDLPIGRDLNIFKDIGAFFELTALIREKRPDILHLNSSKIGGLGALAGRLMRVPHIVFTAHGWAFNEDRTLFSKFLIKLSYWIILFLSHITIAVSEATKSQVKDWPFVYNKIEIIRNGIDIQPMFSKANARHELTKINSNFENIIKKYSSKNLILIGSVGELHPIKGYGYALNGIYNLIEYLKKINPSKKVLYTVVGEGQNKENIEKEIQNLGLSDSVILFGNVPLAFQYIKAFDIFLMPSLSEGLPYVLLEAGLAGMPTIATIVGGIPEIIDDMKSGILIQPRKSKEIQHALEFFLSHKKVQKEYSLAFHDKIVKDFSIQEMIEKTIKVYSANLSKVRQTHSS